MRDVQASLSPPRSRHLTMDLPGCDRNLEAVEGIAKAFPKAGVQSPVERAALALIKELGSAQSFKPEECSLGWPILRSHIVQLLA